MLRQLVSNFWVLCLVFLRKTSKYFENCKIEEYDVINCHHGIIVSYLWGWQISFIMFRFWSKFRLVSWKEPGGLCCFLVYAKFLFPKTLLVSRSLETNMISGSTDAHVRWNVLRKWVIVFYDYRLLFSQKKASWKMVRHGYKYASGCYEKYLGKNANWMRSLLLPLLLLN